MSLPTKKESRSIKVFRSTAATFAMVAVGLLFHTSSLASTSEARADYLSASTAIQFGIPSGIMLRPLAAGLLANGDNFVVGTTAIFDRAWAVRVNPKGEVLWRFERPFQAESRAARAGHLAEFRSIAEMSDGSLFICGTLRSTNNSSSVLIDHVSSSGALIKEYLPTPIGSGSSIKYSLTACAPGLDGVESVGTAIDAGKASLWSFRLVNGSGRIDHELALQPLEPSARQCAAEPNNQSSRFWSQQPFSPWVSPSLSSIAQRDAEGRVTVSLTDNANTEIISVGPSGSLLNHRSLAGRGGFILDISKSSRPTIYSSAYINSDQISFSKLAPGFNIECNSRSSLQDREQVEGVMRLTDTSYLILGLPNASRRRAPATLYHYSGSMRLIDFKTIQVGDVALGTASDVFSPTSQINRILVVVPVERFCNQPKPSVSLMRNCGGAALAYVNVK